MDCLVRQRITTAVQNVHHVGWVLNIAMYKNFDVSLCVHFLDMRVRRYVRQVDLLKHIHMLMLMHMCLAELKYVNNVHTLVTSTLSR